MENDKFKIKYDIYIENPDAVVKVTNLDKKKELFPGIQVVYIPNHAYGDATKNPREHSDCEKGFVTSHKKGSPNAFCRFFRKGSTELRTTTCSESTPVENLVLEKHTDPELIEKLLSVINIGDEFTAICHPSSPKIGDKYENSDTGKAREYTDRGWQDCRKIEDEVL